MPTRRTRRPAPPPAVTEDAIAARLAAKGWSPARTGGRLCTVADTEPAEEGHFLLHAEPSTADHPQTAVLLWCVTDDFISTLAAITGALEEVGYAVDHVDDADGIRVRAATAGELAEREGHALQRLAPLLEVLLPDDGALTLF